MWSLGNTLVTSKLDTAMKVAYYDEKRYRVITTSGEFIDSSGTMTKLPLKNGRDKEDQEFLMKKEATIKRVIASLRERKG
jgi:chromosome segregation ATPase